LPCQQANWKPDDNQVFGCKSLEKTALDASKVEVGSSVAVVSDESLVSKCISEKGKTWEGKMKGKRGKYLGQSGKVIEVDKAKDALLVEFASDNTQMWWGTLYLTAADGKEL
jgi:Tfp pilus assembly protein PilP